MNPYSSIKRNFQISELKHSAMIGLIFSYDLYLVLFSLVIFIVLSSFFPSFIPKFYKRHKNSINQLTTVIKYVLVSSILILIPLYILLTLNLGKIG